MLPIDISRTFEYCLCKVCHARDQGKPCVEVKAVRRTTSWRHNKINGSDFDPYYMAVDEQYVAASTIPTSAQANAAQVMAAASRLGLGQQAQIPQLQQPLVQGHGVGQHLLSQLNMGYTPARPLNLLLTPAMPTAPHARLLPPLITQPAKLTHKQTTVLWPVLYDFIVNFGLVYCEQSPPWSEDEERVHTIMKHRQEFSPLGTALIDCMLLELDSHLQAGAAVQLAAGQDYRREQLDRIVHVKLNGMRDMAVVKNHDKHIYPRLSHEPITWSTQAMVDRWKGIMRGIEGRYLDWFDKQEFGGCKERKRRRRREQRHAARVAAAAAAADEYDDYGDDYEEEEDEEAVIEAAGRKRPWAAGSGTMLASESS